MELNNKGLMCVWNNQFDGFCVNECLTLDGWKQRIVEWLQNDYSDDKEWVETQIEIIKSYNDKEVITYLANYYGIKLMSNQEFLDFEPHKLNIDYENVVVGDQIPLSTLVSYGLIEDIYNLLDFDCCDWFNVFETNLGKDIVYLSVNGFNGDGFYNLADIITGINKEVAYSLNERKKEEKK